MISSTLGAPLGGTMRGGHQGLESFALSLITPPNFGGGGGICFPSIVVVALGEPGSPVTCCATAVVTAIMTVRNAATAVTTCVLLKSFFIATCSWLIVRSYPSSLGPSGVLRRSPLRASNICTQRVRNPRPRQWADAARDQLFPHRIGGIADEFMSHRGIGAQHLHGFQLASRRLLLL